MLCINIAFGKKILSHSDSYSLVAHSGLVYSVCLKGSNTTSPRVWASSWPSPPSMWGLLAECVNPADSNGLFLSHYHALGRSYDTITSDLVLGVVLTVGVVLDVSSTLIGPINRTGHHGPSRSNHDSIYTCINIWSYIVPQKILRIPSFEPKVLNINIVPDD